MFAGGAADDTALYALSSYLPIAIICAVISTGWVSKLFAAVGRFLTKREAELEGTGRIALIAGRSLLVTAAEAIVLVLCTVYTIGDVYDPFLYFRF